MEEMVPLGEEEKRRLVLKAVTRLRCVECGRLYDPEDFALVNRWKDLWVLSTRCRHCDDPVHVIVFMHLELIHGGGLALVIGDTVPVLLGVIALKGVFDVRAHLRQRASTAGAGLIENPA